MKKILFSCILTGIMQTAYAQNYSLDNTIKVNESDSKEVIIQKAAHVVPTDNQLRALEKEFIAFIHFGPNTFTRMEWGTGKEDPSIFNLKTLGYSQQAHLAIVFGYFYPFHWVRTVRTVHQGTDKQVLIGQEPWEQLLTRHLVDTTTAFVSHNRLVGSVEI